MSFKETASQYLMIDLALIDADPTHPRQHIDDASLKGLAHSIQKMGLIHPLILQPANADGRHTLIVGHRRWRAAVLAGEKSLPAMIRACGATATLEVQIFENLGLGLRTALEPREMANAIQTLADRFDSKEAAAEHFGRSPSWLNQATAAANLSPKVSALLDSGKISSTGAAVQLEKLAQKNEVKADTLIDQIESLPEGEKIARKVVDNALSAEGGRRKKKNEASTDAALATAQEIAPPAKDTSGSKLAPWEEAPDETNMTSPATARRINPGKVKMVAKILGLDDGDEEDILIRLIDEFLAMKDERNSQT